MPPAVGYFDTSSDIKNATRRISPQMIGQPHEIAIGPPAFHARKYVVKQPARTEMIVNEMAKLENELHARCRSCEYPSSARRSSSVRAASVAMRAPPKGPVIRPKTETYARAPKRVNSS